MTLAEEKTRQFQWQWSKRHANTEDSYSYTASKDTTWSSTVKLAQGCVTGFKDVNTSKGIEALMTALTQQLVSSALEADSAFFQSYSVGDKQSSGTARNFHGTPMSLR